MRIGGTNFANWSRSLPNENDQTSSPKNAAKKIEGSGG
jgi:hypothetical protein